eukprot:6587275-Prymnesium_polylepis.2
MAPWVLERRSINERSRTISPDQCEKILLERLGNRTARTFAFISSRPPYPLGHCSDPAQSLWPIGWAVRRYSDATRSCGASGT